MKDIFTKSWIIQQAVDVCSQYERGVLTLRALHYQLVSRGMTNDIQHYKRVVVAMGDARWDGTIHFNTFSDLDRGMIGMTFAAQTNLEDKIEYGKGQVRAWITQYEKNRWENQPYYPEVFIEKKALQGVFERICREHDVALGACKGYPSLTFLYESSRRFRDAQARGQQPVIIYFGDYDPSGEDIPRSVHENFSRLGVEVQVERIALMEPQVIEWNLPPAPTKDTDTRSAKWTGLGQVELDAVNPRQLASMCEEAILRFFDKSKHEDLLRQEEDERQEYRNTLRDFVNNEL